MWGFGTLCKDPYGRIRAISGVYEGDLIRGTTLGGTSLRPLSLGLTGYGSIWILPAMPVADYPFVLIWQKRDVNLDTWQSRWSDAATSRPLNALDCVPFW